MPIACPACGRPNPDRSPQCLYCRESLEGRVAEDRDHPSAGQPGPPATNRHLVILAPQPNDSGDRVLPFGEILGMKPYDARLALQTGRLRLLRKVESSQEAEELSSRLASLGIAHFTLAESDVSSMSIVRIRNMELSGDGMQLGLTEGRIRRISYHHLSLLVRGEIVRQRHRERSLGSIQGGHRSLTPGLRFHFYATDDNAAAELDPEQFDWSVLGERRTSSTPINSQRLIGEIVRRAPTAVFDRGFDWEPVVLSRSRQDAEIDSALGSERPVQEAAVYDNESQFRFYSRWRYRVEVLQASPVPHRSAPFE
jgi:hypothetical protein